jgi:predicted NAD/FAD-binding protein
LATRLTAPENDEKFATRELVDWRFAPMVFQADYFDHLLTWRCMLIAVIGGGISGNLAARLLHTQHDVVLFEADDRLGGHAHTSDVAVGAHRLAVDTGFMVFNERNYPNFCRILKMLGIASQPTDMSFSVHCATTGLEFEGSSLNGIFAQRSNLVRPAFYGLLADILRFNREASRLLKESSENDERTVGAYLDAGKYGRWFVDYYLLPMSAAIWSCPPAQVLEFPLHFLIAFMHNHGLLQLRDRPLWRTIVGGSQRYVAALTEGLGARVRRGCAVSRVSRHADHVVVEPCSGPAEIFDHVVIATHADDTLRLLADANSRERDILSAFPYQSNDAILHTDTRLLPQRTRAWASWNYRVYADAQRSATVTYDLTRLQRHAAPSRLLLTLNDSSAIRPDKILRRFAYRHPGYGHGCLRAQRRWLEISGSHRTHFCGAYWGYGFHEDGVNSALRVAKHFGIGIEACTAASTKASLRIGALVR